MAKLRTDKRFGVFPSVAHAVVWSGAMVVSVTLFVTGVFGLGASSSSCESGIETESSANTTAAD